MKNLDRTMNVDVLSVVNFQLKQTSWPQLIVLLVDTLFLPQYPNLMKIFQLHVKSLTVIEILYVQSVKNF